MIIRWCFGGDVVSLQLLGRRTTQTNLFVYLTVLVTQFFFDDSNNYDIDRNMSIVKNLHRVSRAGRNMEADGAEAKHQGHCKRWSLFSNKTGRNTIDVDTSINNNQHPSATISNNIGCFSLSLLQIASSKTVLTLDFRREALRDAAQMTSRKRRPNARPS